MIDPDQFADLVEPGLLSESGSVFYSGRAAFSQPSDLYILGLNPGGAPSGNPDETIGRHLEKWCRLPEYWSAYSDDAWEGRAPGEHGMQPRVRHLFHRIERDLRRTPASNVVFVRSRGESDLAGRKESLLEKCWPVHEAVIRRLGIRTIICFGGTTGEWTRHALGAHVSLDSYRESNLRGWSCASHVNHADVCVVTLTHPSRADWRNPQADPTAFVRQAIGRKVTIKETP